MTTHHKQENSRGSLTITVLYDNNPFNERLKRSWGFAALVEHLDYTLLFDTGGDGPTLLGNMGILGVEPTRIQSVVLSHAHGDHIGGLAALLNAGMPPIVYLPPSFPTAFKQEVAQVTTVVETSPGMVLAEDILTIGEMGGDIPEQALAIRTVRGLVVVTGCAHPGIVKVIEKAKSLFDEPVYLVLGGFHLGSVNEAELAAVLVDFRRLGVEMVAPCHCTGDRAIDMFAEEYGENFIQAGVGKIIYIEDTAR
jgi:7,8-dihydropterin-6-yl-methyl-4-(beta-D-ribofuranosyl)aminobenzene 5'-phosphate synthase